MKKDLFSILGICFLIIPFILALKGYINVKLAIIFIIIGGVFLIIYNNERFKEDEERNE